MKTILALLAVAISAPAYAVDCTVTELIDSSYLEESLSVEEYPSVSVSDTEASLGMSSYSIDEGDVIRRLNQVGFKVSYEIKTQGGERYLVTADRRTGRGTLYGQLTDEAQASLIAEMVCQ